VSGEASALEKRVAYLEPPYRSRGEAKVGRTFDRYEIPFFHELPTVVYDRGRHRIWRPDFTLPTYGGFVVEYAGMPDVPDYMAGIRHKKRAYEVNEIAAVFVYPWDLRSSNWPDLLLDRIGGAYRDPSSTVPAYLGGEPKHATSGGHRPRY
jgi:hypothetical protein